MLFLVSLIQSFISATYERSETSVNCYFDVQPFLPPVLHWLFTPDAIFGKPLCADVLNVTEGLVKHSMNMFEVR
jgi:hypothetical protein